MSYQKLRDIGQNGNVLDQAKQNRIRARQKSVESFPDSYIRETLAAIDGVRHGIQRLDGVAFHPFPARMPLTIAEYLIERLSRPSVVILDPMAGSGTTLIAAKKLGRIGLGFDLDPLAVTLARANTLTLDLDALRMAHDQVHTKALEGRQTLDHVIERLAWSSREVQDFIDYRFPTRSQKELFVLATAIQQEQDPAVQEFLWAVFSSLIVAKSTGASYALDLAHSRPHRDLRKPVLWPLEAWTSRFERALKQLKFPLGGKDYGTVEVRLGDARRLELQGAMVDLVLTSPPYISASRDCSPAIDYIRAHKFALIWMGYDLGALRQLRSTMIGTQCGLPSPNGLPTPIEQRLHPLIPWPAARGRIRRYLSDLHTVLAEIHRVLKPGALAVFVVGPSVISRTSYDAADVIGNVAKSAGLMVTDVAIRKLDTRRRALPPPRRIRGQNSLNKRMRSEVIIVLRKPQ